MASPNTIARNKQFEDLKPKLIPAIKPEDKQYAGFRNGEPTVLRGKIMGRKDRKRVELKVRQFKKKIQQKQKRENKYAND